MAETMKLSTSPRLKLWQATNSVDGFTGGLVVHLSSDSNVSQVDTFIEKPFCTLNLKRIYLGLVKAYKHRNHHGQT
jgi:hypothetical protein